MKFERESGINNNFLNYNYSNNLYNVLSKNSSRKESNNGKKISLSKNNNYGIERDSDLYCNACNEENILIKSLGFDLYSRINLSNEKNIRITWGRNNFYNKNNIKYKQNNKNNGKFINNCHNNSNKVNSFNSPHFTKHFTPLVINNRIRSLSDTNKKDNFITKKNEEFLSQSKLKNRNINRNTVSNIKGKINGQIRTKYKEREYILEMFGKKGWICNYCENFNYKARNICNRCNMYKNPKKISFMKKQRQQKKNQERLAYGKTSINNNIKIKKGITSQYNYIESNNNELFNKRIRTNNFFNVIDNNNTISGNYYKNNMNFGGWIYPGYFQNNYYSMLLNPNW